MMVIRPIAMSDLDSLLAMIASAGVGLTTLPSNRGLLAARIAASEASFAGTAARADEQYMFVLENSLAKTIVGVAALAAAVGLQEPWYSYRVGQVVHASRELGIFNQTPTLFLSNDHTGATELCSLFLHPDFRQGRNGALLSKSRFLFLAQFREHFSRKVIAELRGVSDEQGKSPFWESLGRHFFSMEFAEADYLTGIGKKSFVAELMPKHPLYSSFLTPEAQAVIGQTHALTTPARRLLEQEGFRYAGHVDIFDAGPTVECALEDIDAVRHSVLLTVSATPHEAAGEGEGINYLVATTKRERFRVTLSRLTITGGEVRLPVETAAGLGVTAGDVLCVVALSPKDRGG